MSTETSGEPCDHSLTLSVDLDTPVAMAKCHSCGETVSVVYLLKNLQRRLANLELNVALRQIIVDGKRL